MLFGGAPTTASFLGPEQQLDLARSPRGDGRQRRRLLARLLGRLLGRAPARRRMGPLPVDPPARGGPRPRVVRAPGPAPSSSGACSRDPTFISLPAGVVHGLLALHLLYGAGLPALVPGADVGRRPARRAVESAERLMRPFAWAIAAAACGRNRVVGLAPIRTIRAEEACSARPGKDGPERVTTTEGSEEQPPPSAELGEHHPGLALRLLADAVNLTRSYIIRDRLWTATDSDNAWKPSSRACTMSARRSVSPIPLRRCSGTTAIPSSGSSRRRTRGRAPPP